MRMSIVFFMVGEHPIDNFCCPSVRLVIVGMTMRTAYDKTSISLPTDLLGFLKEKSEKIGTPVSRLIAAAVRQQMESEKRRAKK